MTLFLTWCYLFGFVCLFYNCNGLNGDQANVSLLNDKQQFHLIGPGINFSSFIFPSRYFFVLHKEPFETIKIDALKKEQTNDCRLWTQVFTDTQFCVYLNKSLLQTYSTFSELLENTQFCDDELKLETDEKLTYFMLTIVRYKLYGQNKCSTPLEVKIFAKNGQIAHQQPLFIDEKENNLYSEHCSCANTAWSEKMQCNSSLANIRLSKQIEDDLKPFQNGINFKQVLEQSVDRFANFTRTYSFCLYQIISNELYRKCYGEYVGFARFYDEILLSLLRKTKVADVEFVANLGDWPLSGKSKQAIPMFSWCGSSDSYDIVLPTYELTESILHAQGRITTDILSTFGKQTLTFTQKENKLFWRGRDSHRARLNLIKLAQKDPSKFNVSITNFFFFRDEMHEYMDNSTSDTKQAKSSSYIPFLDFFCNRYQLNIDGTVAAYRFPFLLTGNSLVIKQESPYYEFFYKQLQSGVHFLSTKDDLSDLTETLSKLTDNESPENTLRMKKIIWNARKFVLSHLLPENIYCYYYNVITKYSNLLTTPVKVLHEVELVTLSEDSQPIIFNDQPKSCTCDSENLSENKHDEL